MKIIVILCVIGFVVVYADIDSDATEDVRSLEEETRRIEEYRRPCLEEVGLYSGPNLPINSPTINQIFCLWSCLYKKNGSIKPDGTIDKDVIRSKNPDLVGPIDIIISECEMQAQLNICKLAGCLAKAHLNLLE